MIITHSLNHSLFPMSLLLGFTLLQHKLPSILSKTEDRFSTPLFLFPDKFHD